VLYAAVDMLKNITILFLFSISQSVKGQKLNHELSNLLFGVDVSVIDTTLIDAFEKITSLEKSRKIDTFIIYREKSPSSYFYSYSFRFKKNNYFKGPFNYGSIILVKIDTGNSKASTARVDVWLEFNTKKDLELSYRKLVKKFRGLGSVTIEKPSYTVKQLTVVNEKDNKRLYVEKAVQSFNNATNFQLYIKISNLRL
jgi:hypothetical protein